MEYIVYVDDNFHYMDESERYTHGTYSSCEKATEECKKIVDEFLNENYKKGMKAEDLIKAYAFFGEDPFIMTADKNCRFSARDYAHERIKEMTK